MSYLVYRESEPATIATPSGRAASYDSVGTTGIMLGAIAYEMRKQGCGSRCAVTVTGDSRQGRRWALSLRHNPGLSDGPSRCRSRSLVAAGGAGQRAGMLVAGIAAWLRECHRLDVSNLNGEGGQG